MTFSHKSCVNFPNNDTPNMLFGVTVGRNKVRRKKEWQNAIYFLTEM